MYYLKLSAGTLLLIISWLAVVFVGAFYGWWMKPIAMEGDAEAFSQAAEELLQSDNAGNSAFVLIENGRVQHEYYSNSRDEIDGNTVFLAASMSKWLTAYSVMELVQNGTVNLDTPISEYIDRWQLPPSEFDNDQVTVRYLLSHTAGLTDGLGFGDYEANEVLPSLHESLSNPRTSSDRKATIAVNIPPGVEWRYSGGGYLLLELLVEEVTGQSFQDYMKESLFKPLAMNRSGYGYMGDMGNNAGSYDQNGRAVSIYKYAASAATGLVTSSTDLTLFILSQLQGQNHSSPLSKATLEAMREPHGRTSGFDIWGLGTILYAPTRNGDFVYGHDGANDPAINTTARINPESNDAIIVLVTGHPSLATDIGSQWVLWQTGYPDILDSSAVVASMYLPGLMGVIVLLLLAACLGYRHYSMPRVT